MNSLASAPADVLVIFGITGDPAKKMTFGFPVPSGAPSAR